MDFGRVPERQLNKLDLTLPAEPAFNQTVLKRKTTRKASVYVGCAKWARKEWIGQIYPKGTKEKAFLNLYAKAFNSVELNATHYKLYKPEDIRKWVQQVKGSNFKFAPKLYQGITHFGSLKNKEFLTDIFIKGISAFGKHLGPVFIQLTEKFGPKRKEELFGYLRSLPKGVQFFLEVRHPDWFIQPMAEELFHILRKLKIGAVITDAAGRRDCCHMHLTIPKTFIRYDGNDLHKTDFGRIDEWVNRINYWLKNGLQEISFFIHMNDETFSPRLADYTVKKLNEVCKLDLPAPNFNNG